MIKDNIIIRDAQVICRNFEGRPEKPYNPQGNRNFSVVLDEEFSNLLLNDGWNVKIKPNPQDPDAPANGYLSVNVKYTETSMPRIVQITRRGDRIKQTQITEATVGLLDSAEIKDVKLEIRPYNWEMKDPKTKELVHGVKAYLKTMYYELVEDPFAADYDDPDFANLTFEE